MLVSHREAIGEHMVKTREIVFPGDIVQAEGTKPRNGTYRNSDGTYSSCYFGTVQVSEQFLDVVPFSGIYMPRRGDKVIGKVIDVGPSMWVVDINSAYNTLQDISAFYLSGLLCVPPPQPS